ncbi:CRAL-TRIO domain-containing protein YKL091C-like [Asparagus officinalis]|uniref:CRAL-TRIO domain-containing protein YKL091C-like n=1 Tax=Asparagus officinalis TaxID=4686 RepID=UPI00098E5441|nr:CRAL-TRIO domain-containing protein YKL091C-like [Asparagus officinalis]
MQEVDNFTMRRFLRARDLDINKASSMILKYLKWRREAIPRGFISEEDVQNELRQEKMYMQGLDKKGRPIGVLLGAKHYSSKRNLEEFKRYAAYVLEKLCTSMPRGQEMFVIIADLQGWGYSNCDIRGCLAGLEIMQNYYPERLGKVFVIHVPYLFMKAWKIIYPFIDNKTRKKFVFVEDKNLKSTLLGDIEENQLPEIYGGKLQLVPIDASASCITETPITSCK